MKTTNMKFGFCQRAVVLAVAAAFAPLGHADENEVAELIQPSSSISVGLGGVSGDNKSRSIFGQYNGMRQESTYGLFDIDIQRREDSTGMWTTVRGSNLGLDTREIGASIGKQGDWKIGVNYNEITHREIRTINTADTGVGTTSPKVVVLATPGSGQDIDLKLKRKGTELNGEKWLLPSLLFEFNFRNEDKDGARFSGKGYDCAAYVCNLPTGGTTTTFVKNAILMQAEPVNTNTKQLDMRLVFSSGKLNVQAGYDGSLFSNSNGSVNMTVPGSLYGGNGTTLNPLYPAVAGGTSLQNVLQLPFALQPDNQAHQFFLAGNYAFTNTTKATFKYAYTHATQNDSFAGMGLPGAPAGAGGSLDGVVNTNLVQLGLTSRPLPKLSLNANVRYEERNDKTPKALYNIENTVVWYNGDTSNKKLNAKLEASYQLPANFRGTIGVDYKELEREVPTSIAIDNVAGISTLRGKNTETGYRAELSRVMSDTLSGSIAYITSQRRGSDWTSLSTTSTALLLNTYCGGVSCYGQTLPGSSIIGLSATSIFPLSMADIDRDKWKLSATWNPIESLTLQFIVEDAKDKNVTAIDSVAGGKGFRKNGNVLYSIDAAYTLSEAWQLTAFASQGKQTLDINHSTGYMLAMDNQSDTFGLGVIGKLTPRLEVSANLMYLNDNNHFGLSASPSATGAAPSAANLNQAAIGLPDVLYRQTTLNLAGKYALDKRSHVRLDYVYQEAKLNEWAWGSNGVPFVYADNTTLSLKANQSVSYLGARYYYGF